MTSSALPALLCLSLWSCIHCQTQEVPYISFNGTILANHSYLDLTLVGNMESNRVSCHTDVTTCCSGSQGPQRGDWYFPYGTWIPFNDQGANAIFESREASRVDLRRLRSTDDVSGIYYCSITIHIPGLVLGREFVHIGLYSSGGETAGNRDITSCSKIIL